jgi:hypothetical protein
LRLLHQVPARLLLHLPRQCGKEQLLDSRPHRLHNQSARRWVKLCIPSAPAPCPALTSVTERHAPTGFQSPALAVAVQRDKFTATKASVSQNRNACARTWMVPSIRFTNLSKSLIRKPVLKCAYSKRCVQKSASKRVQSPVQRDSRSTHLRVHAVSAYLRLAFRPLRRHLCATVMSAAHTRADRNGCSQSALRAVASAESRPVQRHVQLQAAPRTNCLHYTLTTCHNAVSALHENRQRHHRH